MEEKEGEKDEEKGNGEKVEDRAKDLLNQDLGHHWTWWP